jgi:Flp pilus assembly protein TadD
MKHVRLSLFAVLVAVGAGLCGQVLANGGDSRSDDRAAWTTVDPEYSRGVDAIKAGKYPDGIRALESYTARVKTNADAENWLGFAYRKTGALDAAFSHYDRALALNPKHRGAHEYMGEAYLLAGNLSKAEEHLRALDDLCPGSCIESDLLRRAIGDYKTSHPAPVTKQE